MSLLGMPGLTLAKAELEKSLPGLELTLEEHRYLDKKSQLTMCVDPDWMPYEKIENGRHVGMSADFMRLFSEKIKIPIVLVPSRNWSESLALGSQRKCDIFSLVLPTPERSKFLDFSDPYIGFPLVIATRYEQIFINDIASILDKNLGIQKGYAYAELLRLQYPSIHLTEVESLAEGLSKVSDKQLFAMIGSLPSIAYIFQKEHMGELKITGKLDQIWQLGVGGRNDEPLLVGIFNKAIANVHKTERQAITNRWMTTRYELGTDYTVLIKVLLVFALVFVFFLYHHLQLRKYNRLLKHLSVTDKLTNMSNRVDLDEKLERNLHLAERYNQPFSLILLDMDHFKSVNDIQGHLVGDYVLQTVATLLKDNIRVVDIAGRWGGEEFLIICPEQTAENAMILAEKIRLIIASFPFEYGLKLSCSLGVGSYRDKDSSDSLIKRADDALYQAKDQGRNKACLG